MIGNGQILVFPSPLEGEGGATCLCASGAPRKGLVVPGGGYANADDPPPARVDLASPPLRGSSLDDARDLPRKGGGEECMSRAPRRDLQ
jgi:hypothetical protein